MSAGGVQTKRRNFVSLIAAELNDLKGLFDMQLARFTVVVDAVVIVYAIREVGILLYFADHHVWANRVGCPCRNEKRIARVRLVRLEEVFHGVMGERVEKLRLSYARF